MMADKNRRLIPQSIQNRFMILLTPIIKILTKWGIHPNSFTLAGVIITSMATVAFIMGHLRAGGVLILAGGLCDSIDGSLARSSGKANRFGALFDSAIDRYSEFLMFFGIATYFISLRDHSTSVVTFLALCGSIMVSYNRARAESLGFESKEGLMQRPERIIYLGIGALIHPLVFKLTIWFVAIFANLTALQRIRNVYKQEETKSDQK